MKEWQFNVLFCVGVGGTVFLLFAPAIPGFEGVPKNPTAIGGIGLILAYVLQQKRVLIKNAKTEDEAKKKVPEPDEGGKGDE